jgi:hypothetical protein
MRFIIFLRPPINLSNEQDIEKLARYLIEDNHEDIVEYDEQLTSNIAVVKSVLRTLLGAYTIYTENETKQLREKITEVNSIILFQRSL